MKSPLVEALRQASGNKSASEDTAADRKESVAGSASDIGAQEQDPDPGDLELMETSETLATESDAASPIDADAILPIDGHGILPIDGAGILPIDGGGILPIDGAGILPIDGGGILPIDGAVETTNDVSAAANEDADAEFYETTSLQLRDDEATDAVAGDADAHVPSALPPVSAAHRHSHMPRLGLYSPLICLALAAVSTVGYFAWQNVGGWHHNSDLESLSSQFNATAGQDATNNIETEQVESHFKLLAGPQRSTSSSKKTEAIRGSAPAVNRSTPMSLPQTAGVTEFEDAAFDALNDAYDAFKRGDNIAAEAGYRRALVLAPRHPNALQGLAAILRRTGRLDESLQYYEALLSVDPGNSAAAVALLAGEGGAAHMAGESEIKYLIQRHPDAAYLHFALGTHFAQKSRWANSRHAFDRALRLDPENADYLFNLAVSLEHLGQYVDARYYYESALDAANATSTLDSAVVVARLERLELLSNPERVVQ